MAATAGGVVAWFTGRLPDDWSGAVEDALDRDAIFVVGTLAAPEGGAESDNAGEAEAGRISRFREETRSRRIAIAQEAEGRYGRKVAWGAQSGGTRSIFTSLSVPVMTRLRM